MLERQQGLTAAEDLATRRGLLKRGESFLANNVAIRYNQHVLP